MASLRAELSGKSEPSETQPPAKAETKERVQPPAKAERSKASKAPPPPPVAAAPPPAPEPVREPVPLTPKLRDPTTGIHPIVRDVTVPWRTMPMVFALGVCLFWIGASGAFLWGYFGAEGLPALGPHLLAFAATITFVPAFLFVAAAYALNRAQAMGDVARRLAIASERLTLADETAANSAQRLGRVVRRELDALSAGLDGAFTRLRALETALQDRVAQLEEAGARAGVKTEAIAQRLSEERQRIEKATEALDATAGKAAESWAARNSQITELLAQRLRDERQNIEQLAEKLDQAAQRGAEKLSGQGAAAAEEIAKRLNRERETIEELRERLDQTATRAVEALGIRSTDITETMSRRITSERESLEQLAQAMEQVATRAAEAMSARSVDVTEAMARRLGKEREGIEQLAQTLEQSTARAGESFSAKGLEITQSVARQLAKEREDIEQLAETLEQSTARAGEAFAAKGLEITEGVTRQLAKEREDIVQLAETLEQSTARAGEAFAAKGLEITEGVTRQLAKERESIETLAQALEQMTGRAIETLSSRSGELTDAMGRRLGNERDAVEQLAETLEQTAARAAENLASRSSQVTETMAQRLREERQSLEEQAALLDAASSRASETLAGKSAQLKALIEAASGSLKSAGQVLEVQATQFREAAEKATAAPHAAAVELDHQAKQIEAVADNVVARAEFVLARQERQRGAMNEMLVKLKEETTAFEALLDGQRKAAENASSQLAAQAQRLDELTLEGLRRVDAAVTAAASRTSQLVSGFGKDADRVKETTDAAAASVSRLVDSLREATASAQALIADSTADSKRRSKEFVGEAMEVADQLLRATASVAEEAEKARAALSRAADDAERHIVKLPGIAAQEAERVREALRGETEKILDNSARALAALQGRALGRRPQPGAEEPPAPAEPVPVEPTSSEGLRGLARRITSPKRKVEEPQRPQRGNFNMSAVLAAADGNDTKVAMRSGATAALNTLQSALTDIAVDLDWTMSEGDNPALWRRYLEGDRGVFARKLAELIGPLTVDRITALYRDNSRFHEAADAYLAEFDALLQRAREGDRGGLLASTLLSADTGKIYLTVAYALGRLD